MSRITWQNLVAPNLIGAANMMEGAQESFNGGLDALRSSLHDRQALQKENVGKMTDYNTGLVLDKLASYKSPEELAAAQASGEIDAFKQKLGGVYDRNKLRGAEADQVKTLQERWRADQAFKDKQFEIKARPLLDQYNTLLANGDTRGAAQFLADNELPEEGMLAMKRRDMERTLVAEQRATTAHNNQQLLFGQSQDAYRRGEAERVTGEEIDALIPSLVEQGLSQADGRATLLKTLEEKGIRGKQATKALTDYDTLYGATNDPTTEESAAAQTNAEKEWGKLQDVIRTNPIEPTLRTSDEAALTEADVREYAKQQTVGEESDTTAVIDNALKAFYKDIGGEDKLPKNFPLGAVLKEALGQAGGATHFFPGGDNNYDESKVKDLLISLGRKELVNSERSDTVTAQREDFLAKTSPAARASIKKALFGEGK